MNNYFLISVKDMPEMASAFAPEGTKLAHELIIELDNVQELPFEFELIKLSIDKGELVENNNLAGLNKIWLDYQPNSLAWPLFSEKLKTIIVNNLTGKEGINWITAKVNGDNEQRIYYIPRFEKMLDVLDAQKTVYIKGCNYVIRPCFSLKKINNYSIFHQPDNYDFWKITSGLYVNEMVKKTIQKEKLIGINFEKVLVS